MFGRVSAGRGLTLFPDDRFLVSYPRSGSTWTRFLIGNLAFPNQPVTFANIEARLPSIYLCQDRQLRRVPRPRLLTSHESFDPSYKTIIYVVRDPRDVAVSFYHYCIKNGDIPDQFPMDDFVSRYLAADVHPLYNRWGSWADHAKSWITMRQNRSGFLLLRYEDMVSDPERELARVAPLLGIDATPEELHRAAQLSSANHMRSLEKEQHHLWTQTSRTRSDIPFVRAATFGGWRTKLSRSSVQKIESEWGDVMGNLGYKLSAEDSLIDIEKNPAR
jgi:plasmid stability protein